METARHYPDIDPRPRYPEAIGFTAPRGTKETLRRAAEAAGISVADLVRDAIRRALAEQSSAGRA